jgi:citrate lyase subunit beta / citryl-CoA lyase
MAECAVLRSMLYVPANSWRMILNGLRVAEDAVILDLEDAVPVGEKETARVFARDCVSTYQDAGIAVFVRVNSLSTGLTEEDVNCVLVPGLDGILLPKTDSAEDVQHLCGLLDSAEARKRVPAGQTRVVALIETPRGVENAFHIAASNTRVTGIAFGAGDFLREMGAGFAVVRIPPEEYHPLLLYPRARLAQAARSNRIHAIDTPFFGLLIDVQGLRRESEQAKLLGFTGKQLIHPRHIDIVNEVFSPSPEDIEYAQSVVAAYEEAKARGAGAASFGARMIDYAMFRMGEDMLAKAQAIAERVGGRKAADF